MEKNIDLQSFDDDGLRARGKGSISETQKQEYRDRLDLARVGKQQVLKVSNAEQESIQSLTS
jgi:choline transport protein